MTAPHLPVRKTVIAIVALIATGCTSPSGPGTLARGEESALSTLPPVTTSPLGTLAPPDTAPSTTQPDEQPSSIESSDSGDEEEPVLAGIDRIEVEVLSLLGPTSDLAGAINTVVPFPRSVPTPNNARITELSVGAATPTDDGTVPAQIGVTVATTDSSAAVFDRIVSAIQNAGMFPIDSTGDSTNRSASFRMPGGDQFDELVVTSIPSGEGALVRVVSNAAVRSGEISPFLDWADSTLPLPVSDRQRTLVVASSTGEGRLAATTISVESSVVIEASSAQREANRLVDRVEQSDTFGTAADQEDDQPLTGPLTIAGLDELSYSVSPTVFVIVDSEGELEDVEALEIRLTGSTRR